MVHLLFQTTIIGSNTQHESTIFDYRENQQLVSQKERKYIYNTFWPLTPTVNRGQAPYFNPLFLINCSILRLSLLAISSISA